MRKAEFGFTGTDLRDRLVAAILRGDKISTSSLLSDYEQEGEALPEVGERMVVVDNDERPVAVIETTEVRVIRIRDVDFAFAVEEGEGFESVEDWRAAHERFWNAYAGPVGDETLMVAERFRLVERLDQ